MESNLNVIKNYLKKKNITFDKIVNLFNTFNSARTLIVGDIIIDRYTECSAIGKTSKTPTLSVKQKVINEYFGGASLFLNNLLKLGSEAELITVIGNDYGKEFIKRSKLKKKIFYIIDKSKPTTIKERFIVDGYKLLQRDIVENDDISLKIINKIFTLFKKRVKYFNHVLISDSRHGLLTPRLIKKITNYCKKKKIKLVVDTQVSNRRGNINFYNSSKVDMISINESEARDFLSDWYSDTKKLFSKILKNLKCSTIFFKLGANGILAKSQNKKYKFPAIPINLVDPIGSGDAFLSSAIICSQVKADFNLNIFISSCSAAYSCTKLGTNPVLKEELINFIKNLINDKI
jgi:rfaE bifunctional protein kinase chain/domain